MQNHVPDFQISPERSRRLSIILLVLGISGIAGILFGLRFYFRHTHPKQIQTEIPILLVLLAVLLINIGLLLYARGNSSVETRRQNILITILAWTAVIYFINGILPSINWKKPAWRQAEIIAPAKNIGIDFSAGLYLPAKEILDGKDNYYEGYAPVVTLLAMPLTFLSFSRAYAIFLILLYTANIVSILGANMLASDISERRSDTSWEIACMIILYTLTSYGMLFSIERGNFDIFVVFLAVIGMLFLVRFPENVWAPALFLSLATHLKLYPGILLFILLWKHGRKSLLPLFAINSGLFLVLGIKPMVEFFLRLGPYTLNPVISVKNSSAVSFAAHLVSLGTPLDKNLLTWILAGIPLLIWLASTIYLYKKGFSNLGMLWYFIISFAPMFALPSVSHDYKLVILSAPLLLALLRMTYIYAQTGSISAAIVIILFMATALFIHRSFLGTTILYFQNKYCAILVFQILSACGMYLDFSLKKTNMLPS